MDEGTDPLLDEARRALPPREHHYRFAHRALPHFARQRPEELRRILTDPRAFEFLRYLWDLIGKDLGPEKALPSVGLGCSLAEDTPQRTIAIVWMPEPVTPPEAWLAAVAFGPTVTGLRYFTLERSFGQRTALCEWKADGAHANYGSGPGADADAFARAVVGILEKEPAQ